MYHSTKMFNCYSYGDQKSPQSTILLVEKEKEREPEIEIVVGNVKRQSIFENDFNCNSMPIAFSIKL